MAAPKGNQFWKVRAKHGRDKLFGTPELLLESAQEYFQWCDDNPLKEQKVFHAQGQITKTEIDKLRAYTLNGLCLFLDCSENYFRNFNENNKDSDDFMAVIKRIDKTIYEQKFSGAAADLLNANIIARDLGLADKSDLTSNGESVAPKETVKIVFSKKKR